MSTSERSSSAPLIAGFIAGSVSTTLLFPLDIVKVRLQVNESSSLTFGSRKQQQQLPQQHQSQLPTHRRLRFFRVFGGIIKHEGVRGIYAGWTPAVIGSAVSWGGYFYFYEGFKRKLVERRQSKLVSTTTANEPPMVVLSSLDNFVLACGAGGMMVLITNPIWLVKLRMQLQLRRASAKHNIVPYSGMIDAFRTIVREEGFFALYRGSGPAMLLTSHGGVQFVVYEFLRKHFHYRRAKRTDASSIWERLELSAGYLGMGAVAKIAASTITYPLQVIKSRMQQRSQSLEITAEGEVQAVRREYMGMMATARKMWNQEGIYGFFKGNIPNALRVAPGAAITFVVYEFIIERFDRH